MVLLVKVLQLKFYSSFSMYVDSYSPKDVDPKVKCVRVFTVNGIIIAFKQCVIQLIIRVYGL